MAGSKQAGRLPTIGFLGADPTGFAPRVASFTARLRALGWMDGRTVAVEYRWSEGRTDRYAEIASNHQALPALGGFEDVAHRLIVGKR